MPYEWTKTAPEDSGAVFYRLFIWPHRSLPRRGFVWFIGATALLMLLPLAMTIGTVILWGLLPFAVVTIWGIWFALQKTYRSGQTWEELRLSRNALDLWRRDPGQPDRHWRVNSYWVRALIRRGPVKNYLTLTDGRREIELGAFLTPEERQSLLDELQRRLNEVRAQPQTRPD